MSFFIFGAGYSGRAFSITHSFPVYGTTRNREKFLGLERNNVIPILFDGRTINSHLESTLHKISHLIITIPPNDQGDLVLRYPDLLKKIPHLQWIGYLSTIGVYGNHHGNFVNEKSPCLARLLRNKLRLTVERRWQLFAKRLTVPLAILRLAGIYGLNRNIFVKLQKGKVQRIIKDGQFFNHVHVADIAGALHFLADKRYNGIVNICDNTPTPPQETIAFAARLMGITPPAEIPFEKANLGILERSFYYENKRISNRLLIKSGYSLKYPDYHNALKELWKFESKKMGIKIHT